MLQQFETQRMRRRRCCLVTKQRTGTQQSSYKGVDIPKTRCASAVLGARCFVSLYFGHRLCIELASSSRPDAPTILVANRPSAVPSLPGLTLFVFFFYLLHFVLHALLNVTAGQESPCWQSAMVLCRAASISSATSQSCFVCPCSLPFGRALSAATDHAHTISAHALLHKKSQEACQRPP